MEKYFASLHPNFSIYKHFTQFIYIFCNTSSYYYILKHITQYFLVFNYITCDLFYSHLHKSNSLYIEYVLYASPSALLLRGLFQQITHNIQHIKTMAGSVLLYLSPHTILSCSCLCQVTPRSILLSQNQRLGSQVG